MNEAQLSLLFERTAILSDQVQVLWDLVRRTDYYKSLPEETREEIEQKYFTYRCGWAAGETRKHLGETGWRRLLAVEALDAAMERVVQYRTALEGES